MRTDWSVLPDAEYLPSAAVATDRTNPVWPASVCRTAPVATFQTFNVRFSLPVTADSPSDVNATQRTLPVWPLNTRSSEPDATSQRRAVLSELPDRISFPSG